ncbi:MAG TPA: hypothetical protein VGC42_12645 [Kofleriaceae bacterium]
MLSLVHGVFPGLMQEILGVVNRYMPGPTGSRATVEGKDAESVFAPSVLTRLSDDAARRNNEN